MNESICSGNKLLAAVDHSIHVDQKPNEDIRPPFISRSFIFSDIRAMSAIAQTNSADCGILCDQPIDIQLNQLNVR